MTSRHIAGTESRREATQAQKTGEGWPAPPRVSRELSLSLPRVLSEHRSALRSSSCELRLFVAAAPADHLPPSLGIQRLGKLVFGKLLSDIGKKRSMSLDFLHLSYNLQSAGSRVIPFSKMK
jgi:hypothetical protein